jgi:tRNA(fMet)-specific endonuclease VapC
VKVLLDTNICIYAMRQKPPQVVRAFSQYAPAEIGVSAITVAELAYGALKSQHTVRNQAELAHFLRPLSVAPFEASAALIYGQVRAQLQGAGTPIGPLDMLIAAHALYLGIPLVTNNVREFSRVPRLQVLNWATT